jgi:hypothetical protein
MPGIGASDGSDVVKLPVPATMTKPAMTKRAVRVRRRGMTMDLFLLRVMATTDEDDDAADAGGEGDEQDEWELGGYGSGRDRLRSGATRWCRIEQDHATARAQCVVGERECLAAQDGDHRPFRIHAGCIAGYERRDPAGGRINEMEPFALAPDGGGMGVAADRDREGEGALLGRGEKEEAAGQQELPVSGDPDDEGAPLIISDGLDGGHRGGERGEKEEREQTDHAASR